MSGFTCCPACCAVGGVLMEFGSDQVNMDKTQLLKLARMKMPFGRYQGRLLMDLPEPYLLWFAKQGFPQGELGELLALMLEIRIHGLESILKPLKKTT